MSEPNKKHLALVTGASRGIGASIARKLASEGFHVLVNFASSQEKAQKVVDSIITAGGSAELCGFNVASSQAVDEAIERVTKAYGVPVSVLVNNAGITIDGLLARLKDEDLDKTLDIDLKGAIYCTRAVSRGMMRARAGSIIQISSVIGEMGNAGQSAYSAAKAGLIGFTKSVAKELGSRGVRANVLTPGFIATEMTQDLTEAQKEVMLRNIPLGFVAEPEDVANVVAFLASSASRYITGQVIGVNGGLYI
ncbi:MAG: 3-oxoacyl-[acyl-carrier-protein] reductase [Bdellovibrionales bacterium]|nr:3-oxoacyl-[acyl-carrier-protein] reductase [Bdellovibrionales bacterium]